MAAPARVWLLAGPRQGELAQQRALVAALGEPHLEKSVFLLGAEQSAGFGFTPAATAALGLVAPWPDLLISFGKTLPAALWVRAPSGGKARIAHLGRPRGVPLAALDLLLPLPQDSLPEAANVLPLQLPLNVPKRPEELALHRAKQRLAHLPRPWTLLLIGASTRHFRLDLDDLLRHVTEVARRSAALGGSLLVSTSPRSPKNWAAPMRRCLKAGPAPFEFRTYEAGAAHQAYPEYLALADECVLTADSASMIADAWRIGLGISLLRLPPSAALLRRRLLRGKVPTLLQRRWVRSGRWAPTVDLDRWLAQLVEEGALRWFAPELALAEAPPPAPDDLPRVVARLRALLAAD